MSAKVRVVDHRSLKLLERAAEDFWNVLVKSSGKKRGALAAGA